MGLFMVELSESTVRRIRVGRTIGVVVMMVALVGCSEAVRDLEGVAAKEVLGARPVAELEAVGVEIDGELDCSSDVDDDNVIVGTCTGTAVDGQSIRTALDGTVERGECSARITISVGDDAVYDESDVDCLEETEE